MSGTHRYDRVSDLLSGRQTTHAAQRTAKSTLTYELGTGEVLLPSPFYLHIYIYIYIYIYTHTYKIYNFIYIYIYKIYTHARAYMYV